MSLAAGTRLGAYEVVAALGVGGMGEVYRARDTRLNRVVAMKVLPAPFASDAGRLARFQREAQVLASLNHPHIAAIYGVEEADGLRALVMELVEGRDLSVLIDERWKAAGRGLDVPEALGMARQIADALDAAHSQGIVHRDLKPANVKVRDDGTVKVLDFGLAKAVDPTSGPNGGIAPTMTSPAMTQMGVLLGTAAYMSPEQARGRAVDKRADIWAFGCVLYEMLTGRLAFEGETMTDVLSAIVRGEPDWQRLPADTPARVRALLAHCLQKEPARRLRDIGDAIGELSQAEPPQGREHAPLPTAPPATRASRAGAIVPWAFGALAALAAASLWVTRPAAPGDRPLHAWHIDRGPMLASARISPDGSTVAFIRNGRIAVRQLSDMAITEVPGTDEAATLFWSADSRSIGYVTASVPTQVRVVSTAGGPSVARVGGPFALTGRDGTSSAFAPGGATFCGTKVVFSSFGDGLVEASEGQPPRLIVPIETSKGESRWAFPSCLPDGRLMATVIMADSRTRLVVLDGSTRTTLLELTDRIAEPVYASSGYVIFQQGYDALQGPNAGIWALPVTPDLSAATGPPVQLPVEGRGGSVSADGLLAMITGTRRVDRQLVWVDRTGARLGTLGRPQARFFGPAISPDGSRVAVMTERTPLAGGVDGPNGIWLYFPSSVREWSPRDLDERSPAWSPDGTRLAFWDARGVSVRPVDGNGAARVIVPRVSARGAGAELSWTPDGRQLLYAGASDGERAVMIADVDSGGAPRVLVRGAIDPALSPDGTLLAYSAFTLDREEVFVTTFPEPGPVWPVSVGGGRRPRWTGQGDELFYTGGPRVGADPNSHAHLFVATIAQRQGRVSVSPPERLFDAAALGLELTSTSPRAYDVAPDGSRILVQTNGRDGTPTVTVIDSLTALLKRRQ